MKESLEDLGKKLGYWFYVDVTEDLMVLWRAYKDEANGDGIELLSNGDMGCTVSCFEEDIKKMPELVMRALKSKFNR